MDVGQVLYAKNGSYMHGPAICIVNKSIAE
jgi:hypothetical protein